MDELAGLPDEDRKRALERFRLQDNAQKNNRDAVTDLAIVSRMELRESF